MHPQRGGNIETYRCFEILIDHVSKETELPKRLRSDVERELQYFREQCLCDLDRRHNHLAIRQRWSNLQKVLGSSAIFDQFKLDQSFWSRVEGFVGVLHSTSTKPAAPSPKADVLKAYETDEFFNLLAAQIMKQPVITPLEQFAIYAGLKFLESEARRGRASRDKKSIKYTWKVLHPLLTKFKLLDPYRSNEAIRNRISFFVKDGF